MVSFFGLKFKGDKKKKADKSAEPSPPQQGAKIDQNILGEGQFFGLNVGSRDVVNGSIRSVPRPGTSSSMRPRSPYAHSPAHNLAAGPSIRDLSIGGQNPTSSEVNLRMNFANASSTSLAAPGPGFGSRPGTPGSARTKPWVNPLDVHFGKNTPSASKSSLAQYELGADSSNGDGDEGSLFGDKPELVAQAIMASVELKDKEEREREKLLEREQERLNKGLDQKREKEKEREREPEWQRKRQQPVTAVRSPPPSPGGYPSPQGLINDPMGGPAGRPRFQGQVDQRPGSRGGLRIDTTNQPMDRPRFQGHFDERPGSRGGMRDGPMNENMARPVFQAQADQRPGSRGGMRNEPIYGNTGRPVFQGQADQRPSSRGRMRNEPHGNTGRPVFRGQADQRPRSRGGMRDGPMNENMGRPVFQGQADQRPGSRGGMRNGPMSENMARPVFQGQADQRPGSRGGLRNGQMGDNMNRPIFQGQADQRPGSRGGMRDGPAREHMDRPVFQGQADQRPGSRGGRRNDPPLSPTNGLMNSPMNGPVNNSVNAAMHGQERSTEPPYRQNDPGPAALPSPTSPILDSDDDYQGQLDDKPVIQNVTAKRDTLAITAARKQSLTMKIEELEKSLIEAQQAQESPRKDSGSSSRYSPDNLNESTQEPLHVPPPPPPFALTGAKRTQSPLRGRLGQGQAPRRPNREEYGVVMSGRMTPDARLQVGGPGAMPAQQEQGPPHPDPGDPASSPPSPRTGPPLQFRQPDWGGSGQEDEQDMSQGKFTRPRPSPIPRPNALILASNSHGAPPLTPDSSNWPLSPLVTSHAPPATQPSEQGSPVSLSSPGKAMDRPKIPLPLNFDFSPQGYSRAAARPFTPPPRTNSERDWHTSPELAARPVAAGNTSGAPPLAVAVAADDDGGDAGGVGLGLQIGMARGLSVRERRRPNHGLASPTGIADNFGTGFI